MNILKITYIYEGEEKEIIFSNIQRFYELYNQKSKELVIVTLNPNVLDEVYFEMIAGTIKTIDLHTESTNDPNLVLDVTISDYEKVRDIRRECDIDNANITTNIIFNKAFE